MNEFFLHPEAAKDISDIWEYIAAENIDAADRVLEEIYAAIRSLVSFPLQGHQRSDLTSKPLRFQSLRDYVIAYLPEEKPLVVIAVLHGRRNPHTIAATRPTLSPVGTLKAGRTGLFRPIRSSCPTSSLSFRADEASPSCTA